MRVARRWDRLAQPRHLDKKVQPRAGMVLTNSSMLELQRFVPRAVMLELYGVHWLVQRVGACGDDLTAAVAFHIDAHASRQTRSAEPRAIHPVRFKRLVFGCLTPLLQVQVCERLVAHTIDWLPPARLLRVGHDG